MTRRANHRHKSIVALSGKRTQLGCGSIAGHDTGQQVMASIAEIEAETFRILRSLTPRGTAIRHDQKLIADLHLASDDATTMALELERKYRVKIPRTEWRTVLTVQDVIDLLARYAA